jgi:hypothetical protein
MKGLHSIILIVVAKGSVELFQGPISVFHLAVGLLIECCGEWVIEAELRAYLSSISPGKVCATVGDQIIRHAMFEDCMLVAHTC